MTCDETRERLPWLLAGSLGGDEAAAAEGHLAGCADCRAEREQTLLAARLFATHPSAADLVAHAFGDLSPAEAERVAAHVARCERCAGEVALVEASRREMERAEVASVEVASAAAARRPAGPSWLALAASIAFALLAGGGWLWTWQRLDMAGDSARRREAALAARLAGLERTPREPRATPSAPPAAPQGSEPPATPTAPPAGPGAPADPGAAAAAERIALLEREVAALREPRLAVAVVELLPSDLVVRGEDGAPPAVTAGSGATLLLVADGVVAGGRYRVRVGRPGAPPLWQGTAQAVTRGELTLHLPAGSIPAGSYEVTVTDAAGTALESYRIAVR
jgi:hypothetical protein